MDDTELTALDERIAEQCLGWEHYPERLKGTRAFVMEHWECSDPYEVRYRPPSPTRDDADFAGLIRWCWEKGLDFAFDGDITKSVAIRLADFIGQDKDPAIALCIAVVAWLDAEVKA